MQQQEVTKYDFIDALRAFAILPVIFSHTFLFFSSDVLFLRLVAGKSVHGVQLFYLASALTLFLSISERAKFAEFNLKEFFIRRFFRIAPLFYLAIIVYSVFYYSDLSNSVHDGLQYWQWHWAPDGIQWWYVPLTALFLNGWLPQTINSVIPVGWSIAIEVTFYLLVPYLYKRIKDLRSAVWFVLLAVTLQIVLVSVFQPSVSHLFPKKVNYLPEAFFYFWFFGQLPVFGLGILTFHIFRAKETIPDKGWGLILLATSFFLFIAFLKSDTYLNFLPAQVFYGLAFVAFSLGLAYYPIKLLVNPLTKWIGKVSFSIYLVHFVVIEFLVRIFPNGFSSGKTIGAFLAFFIVTVISLGISFFTYKYIEVPGMALGKYFIRRATRK